MIVSMWMTRELVTIEPGTPITVAADIMAGKRIRRLPVVKKLANIRYPVGIITATDILHAYPPEVNPFSIVASDSSRVHATAGEIMRRSLHTVAPETPIEEAARIIRSMKRSEALLGAASISSAVWEYL